ncbi:hypothetical protein A0H81_14505 [Grifola frondosa]|uniref:Uncharacterized protein n=1 Tax=Grifola frondosa TaxID=5627 RepID=A0A1C7LL94_GRIFR|nr:hypothetical protein A0H81_14505 [Grifola frondosa]
MRTTRRIAATNPPAITECNNEVEVGAEGKEVIVIAMSGQISTLVGLTGCVPMDGIAPLESNATATALCVKRCMVLFANDGIGRVEVAVGPKKGRRAADADVMVKLGSGILEDGEFPRPLGRCNRDAPANIPNL